jgi:triosephosphate isomerase (TIM)
MRTPLVVGNWKMHLTIAPALQLVAAVKGALQGVSGVGVVFCPPATALSAVGQALSGSPWFLGGQTMHWETKGAYTGEVSAAMLADVGCRYVILGHSERRELFGETDEAVGRKVRSALEHGLTPIVCVGERLAERQAGGADAVIVRQMSAAVSGIAGEHVPELVVAYEPVWAIGTGEVAEPADAQEMAAAIREHLSAVHGGVAADVRILYGGSVKPANIAAIMAQPAVDGALIGGASLDAGEFVTICRYRKLAVGA